jgi:nucleotide-binding universal stress UspA family protein
MSIFPTKSLLDTDGSSEAQLAARTAVELTQKTGSELHTIHVEEIPRKAAKARWWAEKRREEP